MGRCRLSRRRTLTGRAGTCYTRCADGLSDVQAVTVNVADVTENVAPAFAAASVVIDVE